MGVVVTNNTNAIPKRRKLLINPAPASFFIKLFFSIFSIKQNQRINKAFGLNNLP
jgi:hypothetical protein